jgi:nicotinamidase-related amidase
MTPTALLVMDVQQGIVDRFAGDDGYLPRLATAVQAARGAGLGIIYVTVAFRRGYPEVSQDNKTFPRQAEVMSIADWVAGLDWARPAAG